MRKIGRWLANRSARARLKRVRADVEAALSRGENVSEELQRHVGITNPSPCYGDTARYQRSMRYLDVDENDPGWGW